MEELSFRVNRFEISPQPVPRLELVLKLARGGAFGSRARAK